MVKFYILTLAFFDHDTKYFFSSTLFVSVMSYMIWLFLLFIPKIFFGVLIKTNGVYLKFVSCLKIKMFTLLSM